MLEEERKDGYSILIASYNMVEFIEECLNSIKNQTFFQNNDNYEVLVGIDGCNKTFEKIKEIKNKYPEQFKFYFMEENMGVYITINTLLVNSVYDKIICFGSDDIMMPKMIEKINDKIGECDFVKFECANFLDNDIKKIQRVYVPDGVSCNTWKVHYSLGGYKSWRTTADTDFLFRRKNFFKEKTIFGPLFYRRIHKNSLTQNPLTGHGSKQREEYKKQLKYHYNKIEYVQPEINENFEIIK